MDDRDEILNSALEELLSVYMECCSVNKAYLTVLEDEILGVSVMSFKSGLTKYYQAISSSDSPDLVNYDIKLRTRLCNNGTLKAAAGFICNTFERLVIPNINFDVHFDFEMNDLNDFERILFLLSIYRDRIHLWALNLQRDNTPEKRRKFSVGH